MWECAVGESLREQPFVEDKRRSASVTPRWVKVFCVIALGLIAVFAVLHLTGHGIGGHSMHGGGQ